MSRPLRVEFEGAIHHVTSRGNERRDIVRSGADRSVFVRLLAQVVHEYGWILHAWVLMTNHYHLVIETPRPNLSRGMHDLNGEFAEYFNGVHRRVGHLFQGRFGNILVERESHLLALLRYVVLNPVRAGMVENPAGYKWSNYRATAGLIPAPVWLETDWTLLQFHEVVCAEARERYRRFVADARGMVWNLRAELTGGYVLGGEAFCERVQSLIDRRIRSREHPQRQVRLVLSAFEQVIEEVSNEFGVSVEALKRRGRSPARKALAQLGREESGLTLRAIGEWMGATGWAISKLASRSTELAGEDAGYRASIERVRARLES